MKEATEYRDHPGRILGISILAALILPLVYWQIAGFAGIPDWYKGVWAVFAGTVCFAAYFLREKTFLFRGILSFLRRFHIPPGEWFALVYGALFFAIALYYFGSEWGLFSYT